jgi:hypothetical protein
MLGFLWPGTGGGFGAKVAVGTEPLTKFGRATRDATDSQTGNPEALAGVRNDVRSPRWGVERSTGSPWL